MKSLRIMDEKFRQELLSLPTPLSFIDFETMSAKPSPIPGTRPDDTIPTQWSNHRLTKHGLDWQGNLFHDEYLWVGDWEWNPVYSFIESLYESTKDSKTILIYSNYEITVMKLCIQIAENDMNAYTNGLTEDYVVVNMHGNKVPLMNIAPKIKGWCEEMIAKCYDLHSGKNNTGGVKNLVQSPDLNNSNSIKQVCPVSMDEYSGTSEIMKAFKLPENGYEGLKQMGNIAKGDECMSKYISALNRPPRDGVKMHDVGAAPFDENIREQCLRYCCLDTLAMVIIYLAVLEASERWQKIASGQFADYALFYDDGIYHSAPYDGDTGGCRKACELDKGTYDSSQVELVSRETLGNMNVREFYAKVCPRCRKQMNH